MIRFNLAQPMRVRFVVRGPAPSCRVLGVIRVRGKAGANKILFAGRLHGRRLVPGIYSLTLTRPSRPGPDTVVVRVVRAGKVVPLRTVRRRPADCASTFAPRGNASLPAAGALGSPLGSVSSSPSGPPPAASREPVAKSGILGAKTSNLDAVHRIGSAAGGTIGTLPPLAGIALLIALVLAIAATMFLVVRFLRGSWNP